MKPQRAHIRPACQLAADYTQHDARHSFAVRWMRAGIDPNLIAANLGHKNSALVMKVYGKHRPRAIDFARLDAQLTQPETLKRKEA